MTSPDNNVGAGVLAEVRAKYGDPVAFAEHELVVLVDVQALPIGTKLVAAPSPATHAPPAADGVGPAFPRVPSLPGNWPEDATHENGDYECTCCHCGATFYGHKRRVTCKVCATPPAGGGDGTSIYALLRSIRYNATHGSQDRPLHERLRLIAEDAEKAIAESERLASGGGASADARDAARYRWLRESAHTVAWNGYVEWNLTTGDDREAFDAAVDEAMGVAPVSAGGARVGQEAPDLFVALDNLCNDFANEKFADSGLVGVGTLMVKVIDARNRYRELRKAAAPAPETPR